MDDKPKEIKNQSEEENADHKPIFESVQVEPPANIKPEEVSPEVASPEDVLNSVPPEITHDMPPVYEESKGKYFIIAFVVIFFVALVIIIVTFLMRGRNQPGGSPDKDITLQYWGLWEEKEIYEPLINEYQSKNKKVKIVYQKMTPDHYREKLQARKEKGPDIFRFHNTWLPEIQDVASPLPTNVMSTEEFEKTFYKVAQKDLKNGDKYYGIPLYIDGLVLIYNDALLKQAGIVAPPNEWIHQVEGEANDMLTVVSKLTVKDSSDQLVTSGLAAGTTGNIQHFSEFFGLLLLLNGGDLKNLDTDEATGALQLYRKFAEENYWNDTMPNSISAFMQGKVAMIIAPSWQVLTIKAQSPDIQVKVAPIPQGLDGKSISIANYWVEGVSKYSKNQEEAWKFLKFLAEKDSMTKMYEQQSKVRLFGTAYSRVDLAEKLVDNEYLGPVILQADSYVSLPIVERTYDNGLNDDIVQYLRNAINETIKGVDYTEALKTANNGIKQVFERYKIE